IPDVVMDHLEVPLLLPRARVERQDAVAIQVVARPIAAVEVVLAARGRHIDDAPRRVDRQFRPVVGAADLGAPIRRPRPPPGLALLGYGGEGPPRPPGPHVEAGVIARCGGFSLFLRRSKDDRFLDPPPRQAALLIDRLRLAIEPLPQIDPAVLAERGDAL